MLLLLAAARHAVHSAVEASTAGCCLQCAPQPSRVLPHEAPLHLDVAAANTDRDFLGHPDPHVSVPVCTACTGILVSKSRGQSLPGTPDCRQALGLLSVKSVVEALQSISSTALCRMFFYATFPQIPQTGVKCNFMETLLGCAAWAL